MKKQLLNKMCGILCVTVLISTTGFNSQAAEYQVDTEGMHAFIQFRIVHLGFSILLGRFNDFSGSFSWDEATPGAAKVNIEIKTNSVDTNHAERDKHIRGEDFLEVKKYPTATFKSTKFSGDASGGNLKGVLTLHGVSKEIVLDVKAVGEGDDPWGEYRAGFSATTSIKRSDFGINYNLGPAAETMDFELHLEGIRQ